MKTFYFSLQNNDYNHLTKKESINSSFKDMGKVVLNM
jgi:hypothetical protein